MGTVADFKRMIEEMNIPDDAEIKCVTVVSRDWSQYGEVASIDFTIGSNEPNYEYFKDENIDYSRSTNTITFGCT